MKNNKLEKIVEFTPAFDKRHPDPSKNYGIHGVELRMLLKGDKGVVQFVVYTHWQLPHVHQEILSKCKGYNGYCCSMEAQAADLGYHSPKPIYEGQEPATESCQYLDGKPCYYDGSGLNAIKVFDVLKQEGDKGVWRELENYYCSSFVWK